MWNARIVEDSLSPAGARITTWVLSYPRFIHSELMTHREFSRNAASSRAIPVSKVLEQVLSDPAMPISWGKNQKGMQSREELSEQSQGWAINDWLYARNLAVDVVKRMQGYDLHKQVANRLLEPFTWMTTIVTATDFANFFKLRLHPDAQPEFRHLASLMKPAYGYSNPRLLRAGEWHLPFSTDDDLEMFDDADCLKICTGRCARVSYLTHDGKRDPQADIDLHNRLSSAGHWSPFEHCAMATTELVRSGNFTGFIQYRKRFEGEYASSYGRAGMKPDLLLCAAIERERNVADCLRHVKAALTVPSEASAFIDVALSYLGEPKAA